jgi:hypothetical protein
MLCGGADVVADAREEYMRDGTLSVTTYAALTGQGFEADVLMAQFESSKQEQEDNG